MATSSRTLRSTLIALIALAALGLALTTLHAEDAAKAPRLVIKKGTGFVRPVFICSVLAVTAKLFWDNYR